MIVYVFLLVCCFASQVTPSSTSDNRDLNVLIDKIYAVVRENAELRDRITELEEKVKSGTSCDIHKGRRQVSPFVAFSAYLDHQLTGLPKGAAILYNKVITNEGAGYNNATGIFQAPRSGLYLFSWSTTARRLSGQANYDVWADLVIEGSKLISTVAESRDAGDDNQGSNTIVVRVNAGQRVWTKHFNGYDKVHGDNDERTTSFTGVLLYEYE